MTTIRRIVTSKIDGNDANVSNTSEIRPFGEAAFYLEYNDRPVLSIHDGIRTHLKSKVLGPGILYGSNADSGDGAGLDTIKLIPDANLHYSDGNYNNHQHVVIDPTAPNHIHVRAGGTIDQSTAELYLGGEKNYVRVSDIGDSVTIKTTLEGEGDTTYFWNFDNSGNLTVPGALFFNNGNGTIVGTGGILSPVQSDYYISTQRYQYVSAQATAASGAGTFVADISANDDITAVQIGWLINVGSIGAPILYTVTNVVVDPGVTCTISVAEVTFDNGVTYSFRLPTPVQDDWMFNASAGALTTPGGGTISHQNNDLKIEVVGGTDVIVLRTAGGDVVVTSAGDLQLDGSIFTGVGGIVELTNTGVLNTFSPVAGSNFFNIQSANNYGVSVRSTDLNGDTKDWLFGIDGGLTLPYNNRITVGGNMDTNAINFVLQDSLSEDTHQFSFDASNGYPSLSFPDGSFQTTAWTGGRVVDVPTSSTGTTGDLQGDLAFSSGYIYYCTQNFGNSVNLATLASSGSTVWVSSVGYTGDLVADFTANSTGWTYNGVTINSATADNSFGPGYALVGATGFGTTNGYGYALVYPSVTNIWKRVAWSGDTW